MWDLSITGLNTTSLISTRLIPSPGGRAAYSRTTAVPRVLRPPGSLQREFWSPAKCGAIRRDWYKVGDVVQTLHVRISLVSLETFHLITEFEHAFQMSV